MATRAQIVAEARTWIGTTFHHQGRVKGAGVDCAGVAIGVAQALDLEWTDVSGYAHTPAHGQFMQAIEMATDRISFEEMQPGDLMVFAFDEEPQHVAIVTQLEPYIMLVHAWAQARKCVETILDDTWKNRLRGCYRYRGVDG